MPDVNGRVGRIGLRDGWMGGSNRRFGYDSGGFLRNENPRARFTRPMRYRFPLLALSLFFAFQVPAAVTTTLADDAPVPPLLLDALTKLSQDFDRWAYTETRNATDSNGKSKGETVVRFDPSKPYAEQYTPLKVDGQPPKEKQLKDYRKRGERRGERLARDEAAGKTPGSFDTRLRMNGENALVDLPHATMAGETETSVTFLVPLRRDEKTTLPVEKFELLARVSKERRAFEHVSLRLRDSFRMKLVVKVQSGDANIDFTVVDPKFVPVPSEFRGGGAVSVMFIKFGGTFDLKRTDFQRVKPYSEKFGVKIGPLKALDF